MNGRSKTVEMGEAARQQREMGWEVGEAAGRLGAGAPLRPVLARPCKKGGE